MTRRWSVFSILAFVFFSACTASLPNVNILKTKYPLVHYTPLPKNMGKKVSSVKPRRETSITFEKSKPATWVSFGDISKKAVGAIVVSEDWAFYQHKGYDPNQMKEAMTRDMERGKFSHGASTITQQVAKNVFLNNEKTLGRKLKELMIAVRLEEALKKQKILEIYLNIAEFGEGLYGIGPAAQFYFNKPASQLTAKEGAFLAMLLPSPKRYSVSFRQKSLTPYARKIIGSVLSKMVQAHYLTEEEKAAERAQPLSFESSSTAAPAPQDPHEDLEDGSGASDDEDS